MGAVLCCRATEMGLAHLRQECIKSDSNPSRDKQERQTEHCKDLNS
jgi:hypothetical protein